MRYLPLLSIACLLALGLLGGCGKRHQFPDTPHIDYTSARLIPGVNGALDSIILTVGFQDGNGDLGLLNEERQGPPYKKYLTTNKQDFNLRYYNYFPTIFIENAKGGYDTLAPKYTADTTYASDHHTVISISQPFIDEYSYYSAFQPTLDMNQGQAIEGTISFSTPGFFVGAQAPPPGIIWLTPGKKWKFTLSIMDRAGHMSNKITSQEFVYNP